MHGKNAHSPSSAEGGREKKDKAPETTATPEPATVAEPQCLLEALRQALKKDSTALGERLAVIGSGPISVQGSLGGVLALDAAGAAVLVAAFSSVPPGAGASLADELDRLGQLTGSRLAMVANEVSFEELDLLHQATFDSSRTRRISFNAAQRAIVVTRYKPGPEDWKDLRTELGPQLGGVHLLTEQGELAAEPIPDLLRRTERSRATKRWIAAAAGVSLLAGLGIGRSLGSGEDRQTGPGPLISTASVVAVQVPADATQTGWIGQRRLVRTSDGRLVAAYSTPEGLKIVTDQANQGRSWDLPQPVAGFSPRSFAMAIDSTDRLHIAFQDSQGIGYVQLKESLTGLVVSPIVRVDPTTSPVVDIAFDSARSVAHVSFVRQESEAASQPAPKQQPAWAAIAAPPEGPPSLVNTQVLAEPGNAISVLSNIGIGPGSNVIVTYRRGDSVNGWFARYLNAADPAGFMWSAEEPLPVADALYGASSMAVDLRGNAHVVLRDNTTYGLTYLKRAPAGNWLPSETIVDAEVTEQIDFPSISPDLTSESVFVFYQDTTDVDQGQIKAVSRDPQSGWGSPGEVASGSWLPTSIEHAAGLSIVLSTNTGSGSVIAQRVGAG